MLLDFRSSSRLKANVHISLRRNRLSSATALRFNDSIHITKLVENLSLWYKHKKNYAGRLELNSSEFSVYWFNFTFSNMRLKQIIFKVKIQSVLGGSRAARNHLQDSREVTFSSSPVGYPQILTVTEECEVRHTYSGWLNINIWIEWETREIRWLLTHCIRQKSSPFNSNCVSSNPLAD